MSTPIPLARARQRWLRRLLWLGLAFLGSIACDQAVTETSSEIPEETTPLDTLWVSVAWNRLYGVAGAGRVYSSPRGIDCVTPSPTGYGACWALFPRGSRITLTATWTGGASFLFWSAATRNGVGQCAGDAPTCQLTMRGPAGRELPTEIAIAMFLPVQGPVPVLADAHPAR